MKFCVFAKEKAIFIVLTLTAALMGGFALYAFGCPALYIVLTGMVYLLGGFAALLREYGMKRSYYQTLSKNIASLDQKHYLAEIMEDASFYEGRILKDTLKAAAKSMNDEIAKYEKEKREYREYIEMWVHEIKTPISGARLICENNALDHLMNELDEIEKYVEQALYYARSGAVEKDYLIREVEIKNVVNDVVKKNTARLIAHRVKIEIRASGRVHTAPKWLAFILQQLVDNSVKYGAKTLVFAYEGHTLTITDDGVGIPQSDLPRIFDYGFTGENGRRTSKSTGIGLYLCKKLCDKMGLEISAASEDGVAISLLFPENPYVTFL